MPVIPALRRLSEMREHPGLHSLQKNKKIKNK
jgi:hypothetical protein